MQPDHTRLRGLVHQAFTPRLIENMRGRVQALTDELLDRVESRGRMDLIHDYALPLPATIIAEILGVPARDRHRFHRWSNAMLTAKPTHWGKLRIIPHVLAMMRYIRKMSRARRAESARRSAQCTGSSARGRRPDERRRIVVDDRPAARGGA